MQVGAIDEQRDFLNLCRHRTSLANDTFRLAAESGFAPDLQCLTENKIDVAPKLGNAQSIVSIFDQTSPLGGTPTADAIKIAADNLSKIGITVDTGVAIGSCRPFQGSLSRPGWRTRAAYRNPARRWG